MLPSPHCSQLLSTMPEARPLFARASLPPSVAPTVLPASLPAQFPRKQLQIPFFPSPLQTGTMYGTRRKISCSMGSTGQDPTMPAGLGVLHAGTTFRANYRGPGHLPRATGPYTTTTTTRTTLHLRRFCVENQLNLGGTTRRRGALPRYSRPCAGLSRGLAPPAPTAALRATAPHPPAAPQGFATDGTPGGTGTRTVTGPQDPTPPHQPLATPPANLAILGAPPPSPPAPYSPRPFRADPLAAPAPGTGCGPACRGGAGAKGPLAPVPGHCSCPPGPDRGRQWRGDGGAGDGFPI